MHSTSKKQQLRVYDTAWSRRMLGVPRARHERRNKLLDGPPEPKQGKKVPVERP